MSAISQKSISGITSITSPAGTDDQISLHTSNTNEALKIDGAGNLHLNNHVNTTGVSTASNFKTGSSNLHSTGLNVQDLDVDGHTNLDNVSVAGVSTFSAGINVPDNQRINVGNGNDLYLKHDGTNSELHNNAGNLTIDSGIHLNITNVHGEDMAKFLANGAVELYHDNIKRLETSSVGVSIPQDLDVDGHTNLDNVSIAGISSTGNIYITTGGDGRKLSFAGDGSSHYIKMDHTLNGPIINGYGGIAFETNGTNERLRITSGGKIGVNYAGTPPSETMMISSGDSTTALSASHLSGGNRYGFRLSTISGTNTGMTFSTFMNSSYSEKLVINGNGELLVGHTSSPTSDADKIQAISTSSGTGICLHNYSASAYGNQIAFMKSRNNTIGSNTLLNTGDRIGELNFYGNDGSGRSLGAQIQVRADGTQSNNNSPSRINFLTGLNQSMNTRLAIHPAGTVGVSKGGYANSDHSMSLTVHTGTDLNDGLMIISNYNGGNQNSDTGKLMFCGSGQTNGVYIYKDNEVSYGKGALVFHTRSTANDYSTQLAETARFTAYGRFGLGTGGPGQTTVDSLMHIQGNSDDGDAACQLTIEDEDTSAGSKIPSIQFKGNGVNTGRIRGTDTGGIQFHTWNGSSDIARAIIGNHAEGGAMLLYKDDRGWATFRHNESQGLRTHVRQYYSPGNAVQTQTILRIRRHWWGWGTYKIRCKALYYNSSLESTYFVNGHGSGGNSYSIGHETYGGDVSSQNWNCTITHTASNNAPGSSSTWYADIKVNIPNYYYVIVYIEAYSSSYSTDPNNISADGYCLM